jgi:hypothetical protein
MKREERVSETSKREPGTPSAPPTDRKPWEEPKLAFVEPKLTKHGDLEKVTGKRKRNGFFGDFSP